MKLCIELDENEQKIWKEQNTVTGFSSLSVWACLSCARDPSVCRDSNTSLGVDVLKKIFEELKKYDP